jgi:hypothetical protein
MTCMLSMWTAYYTVHQKSVVSTGGRGASMRWSLCGTDHRYGSSQTRSTTGDNCCRSFDGRGSGWYA